MGRPRGRAQGAEPVTPSPLARGLRLALPLVALACAASRAPHAGRAAGVDCVAYDEIISEPFLVAGQLRAYACPLKRLQQDEVFAGWVKPPIHTLPGDARVSVFDPEVVLVAPGPGPDDADMRYLRVDFADPALATAWFDAHAPTGSAWRPPSYRVPERWPLHPSSRDYEPEQGPPAWWPLPDAEGDAVLVQAPKVLDMCITEGASGELWFRAGATVWIHTWYRQWIGGCGG